VSRDSIIFGVAGTFFGLLVGWIIGSQQGTAARQATAPAAPQQQSSSATSGQTTAAPFDDARANALKQSADRDPRDARSRLELANLYFDAERFEDAARWYEAALSIDPKNVNASTDLGISYYYTNQADKALAQFDRSLALDPRHAKTLLNIGIVRAFAKEDLSGAAKVWQQVVEISPDSAEGRAARQALEGLRSAHPNLPGLAPATGKAPGSSN
jgi:tetratricopeptide (TPR) repeat protein